MKNSNKYFYVLFIFMFLLVSCQDEQVEDEVKRADAAIDNSFDEEKFRQAVQAEVEKTLRRAGQGNLVDLTRELMQKEQEIKSLELEIEKKKEELQANMSDFHGRVQAFREEQQRFIGCVDDKDDDIDNRVSHMVNVVSGMRPQNAAEVLSVQDADIAVMILERLNPDNVARIFNQMDKEISARLQKQFMSMEK